MTSKVIENWRGIAKRGDFKAMDKNIDSEIWIEMLPANEGDCFLITIPSAEIHILVDGGTRETYHTYLKERLLQLKEQGSPIDLLVVTHIDNDHIGGIIELLRENGSDCESKIIKINNVWHNSYRHLQFDRVNPLGTKEALILRKIVDNGEVYEQSGYVNGRKGISALQGTTLGALILSGGYCWNQQFNGLAVSNKVEKIGMGKECVVSVLLPGEQELCKLAKRWKRELQRSRLNFQFSDNELFDDAFEYYWRYISEENSGRRKQIGAEQQIYGESKPIKDMVSYHGENDSSETNRASISLQIEYKSKHILLLADNVADNALKMLAEDNRNFDAVKLPHHGSIKNISNNFIDKIDTSRYLVSTNSEKYGHPDLETIAQIACKETRYRKQIFFNYDIEKVRKFEQEIMAMNDIEFIYLQKGQKIVL